MQHHLREEGGGGGEGVGGGGGVHVNSSGCSYIFDDIWEEALIG